MIDSEPQLTAASCPEIATIPRYLSGNLDEQRALELETHILDCAECATKVDAIDDPSDAIIQALVTLPLSTDDEAEYQSLRSAVVAEPYKSGSTANNALLQHAFRLADPDLGPLPCRLGNYELLTCIGRGASGAVYRARHLKLDQTVAVKVLDASRSLATEAFIQEMKTLGSLTHPHVVRATDAGEANGLHFLVMEYIEGIDAARLLYRHGPLDATDACEIVRQAALGLQFVHEQSLVHRDIKPSNLLVTSDGQVKLLDLGIATRRDQQVPSNGDCSRPQGTFDYMAPELWANPATVDPRTDLYSLGCTLFKLLTGGAPSKDSAFDPKALSRTPRTIQRLLDRLLSADPKLRPSSVSKVIDTLRPCCRGADLPELIHKTSPALKSAAQQQAVAALPKKPALLSRRAAIGGITSLAGATFLSQRLNVSSPSKLKRIAWRSLVPVDPKLLLTPASSAPISIRSKSEGEYQVTSDHLALVHMGRPVNGLFSLAVDMVPNKSPNCGIFFKGKFDYSSTMRTFQFQSVELLSVNEADSQTPELHLLWSEWPAIRVDDPSSSKQIPLAEVKVELASNAGTQRLQVTCGRQGMPEIEWNGQTVPESRWQFSSEGRAIQRMSSGLLPTAYLGRLGLINTFGTTIFRKPRLAYL